MTATPSIQISPHFRRQLGTGFFGGEGFILQKVSGQGWVFLEIIGEVCSYDLQPGECLCVEPGHLAFYEPSVGYELQVVKGVRNMLFSGESIFLASLTGPGKVWLHSLSMSRFADSLIPYLPNQERGSSGSSAWFSSKSSS